VAAALLPACGHTSHVGPQASYDRASLELVHGEFTAASDEASRSLKEYESKDVLWAWRFRELEARALLWQGLSGQAVTLLDTPFPASLSNSDVSVRRLLTTAIAQVHLSQFDAAERNLACARALVSSSQPQLEGEVDLASGTLAFSKDERQEADVSFRGALVFAEKNNQLFLRDRALGSLGLISKLLGHYDESVDWYEKSLALSESLHAQGIEAKTLGNLAWDYYDLGDTDRAADLFSQAEAASERLGVVNDRIIWLTNIGNIKYRQKDYAAAMRNYNVALDVARGIDDKKHVLICLNNLAVMALGMGTLDSADQYSEEAAHVGLAVDGHSEQILWNLTRARIAVARGHTSEAESLFLQVIRDPSADAPLRWEAQADLASNYATQNQPLLAEREFRDSLDTIEQARSSLNNEEFRLSFLTDPISVYDEFVNFFISHNRPTAALEVAELSRARTLAKGLGVTSTSLSFPIPNFQPAAIARRSHALILYYWLGSRNSHLWVIAPSGVISVFTLPPSGDLKSLADAYHQAVLGPQDPLESQNRAGFRLFEILVGPVSRTIPPDSRVVLIPDGPLAHLNFETLLVSKPKPHYWIEDVAISNATSLILLGQRRASTVSSPGRLLLMGDPVSVGSEYPQLPQARREMQLVERYFAPSERSVFSGAQATVASYLSSQPQTYGFIHFVAHGTASVTSPLDSAIILSPEGGISKLYAREIVAHPLEAGLVTISSCYGAGIRTYSGEGLIGLSWAFLRAGAHNVIAALWEANDSSTPELMDRLYADIHGGEDTAHALRNAKLQLLHSDSVYRKPFYWAPFQLYSGL
jgi:CHAT domain-containing protein/tetratricopeptide (TPR) repeat protein